MTLPSSWSVTVQEVLLNVYISESLSGNKSFAKILSLFSVHDDISMLKFSRNIFESRILIAFFHGNMQASYSRAPLHYACRLS